MLLLCSIASLASAFVFQRLPSRPYRYRDVSMAQNGGTVDMAKEGKFIESLLASAVGLAEGFLKGGGNDTDIDKSLLPAKLSFSLSHKEKIILQDRDFAKKYLSLPASEYSLLSSKYVSRDGESDRFEITVPIGKVGSGSSLPHEARMVDMSAISDVTVSPQPDEGRVVMTSGPILFAPQSSSYSDIRFVPEPSLNDSEETSALASPGDDLETLRSILPPWLVAGDNNNDDDDDDVEKEGGSDWTLKSSIQAGFEVTLTWPTGEEPTRGSRFLSFRRKREAEGEKVEVGEVKDDAPSSADGATTVVPVECDQTLLATARVRVWVDLNLPLRSDVSRAVNFPPIRLLLEQAGALTAKTAITGIAPTLADLLRKDCEKRRLLQQQQQEIKQLP